MELRLSGLLNPREQEELRRIQELLQARFLHGRMRRRGVWSPRPEDDPWLVDLPPGVLQETARRLQALSDPRGIASVVELYRLVQ